MVKRRYIRSGPMIERLVGLMKKAALAGGPAPSNAELAEVMGYKSTSVAVGLLGEAERLGLVRVRRGQAARVVEAADGSWRTAGDAGPPHWRDRPVARPGARAMNGMVWTDALVAELRRLWGTDLSSAAIARAMGVSKNAVVGKAHRLKLAARPNPVQRAPGAAAPRRARSGLAAVQAARAAQPPRQVPAAVAGAGAGGEPVHAPRVPARPDGPPARLVAPAAPRVIDGGCRWPLWGHRERPTHRYCGAAQALRDDGSRCAWCPAHAARVFQSVQAA